MSRESHYVWKSKNYDTLPRYNDNEIVSEASGKPTVVCVVHPDSGRIIRVRLIGTESVEVPLEN